MKNKACFTSNSEEWATPIKLFNELNNEFHFTLDPCATHENHKCDKYFTKEVNGLTKDWKNETVFVNPPYSKTNTKLWVEKAYYQNKKYKNTIVMLLPSRTDTKWFHEYIYGKTEIRFIKGRLKFNDGKFNAPFPSMIVIFR